jgi:hypothetical protein
MAHRDQWVYDMCMSHLYEVHAKGTTPSLLDAHGTPTDIPKHIRGGWPHHTNTSEPVDNNGAQNMVTVLSGFEPATFRSLAHELTTCSNRVHILCMYLSVGIPPIYFAHTDH